MTHLLHHWLVKMRGGENVLQELLPIFPKADIYSLFCKTDNLSASLRARRIFSSILNNVPGACDQYFKMLPLFPLAVRTIRFPECTELVFCSDASVIKGARLPKGTKMVCFCHSPPRYLWDLSEEYAQRASTIGAAGRLIFRCSVPFVREFDRRSAQRVEHFIANSRFVQRRIKKFYGRDSTVINPPVDLEVFTPSGHDPEEFYLVVSHLVPYKRIDIAVDAFNALDRRLVIIGNGTELEALKRKAGRNIEFLGSQPKDVLADYYRRCRAFIFPGIEDFGITPLEAMASGRPVIAFAGGGVLETVMGGETGMFFEEQTPQALMHAVMVFEKYHKTDKTSRCRKRAESFSADRFRMEIASFISKKL